jgi:hypothetical protein
LLENVEPNRTCWHLTWCELVACECDGDDCDDPRLLAHSTLAKSHVDDDGGRASTERHDATSRAKAA